MTSTLLLMIEEVNGYQLSMRRIDTERRGSTAGTTKYLIELLDHEGSFMGSITAQDSESGLNMFYREISRLEAMERLASELHGRADNNETASNESH